MNYRRYARDRKHLLRRMKVMREWGAPTYVVRTEQLDLLRLRMERQGRRPGYIEKTIADIFTRIQPLREQTGFYQIHIPEDDKLMEL